MLNQLNIWQVQSRNYVNGPGCRFVIWVQGCHLACPECWNKHTWSFKPKRLIGIDELFDQIKSVQGISGVTFSGGEPFAQAKPLYYLAKRVREELKLHLQIFTGFEMEELKSKYQKLLKGLADVVVTGRFDSKRPNNNQKVHNLKTTPWNFNNTDVEVEVDEKGDLVITGYPPNDLLTTLKRAIK